MKIEGSTSAVSSHLASDTRAKAANKSANQAPQGDTTVAISSLSSSLGKAEAAIAATPTVNQERVAEIRQAIAEGRFTVDPQRIADGLLSSVRDMLQTQG